MVLDKVKNLELWNGYKNRCIGCGRCGKGCITCSCMSTIEIVHTDNTELKETIRTWSRYQLVKSKSLKNMLMNDIVPTRIRQE